jgi:hypothetical protein
MYIARTLLLWIVLFGPLPLFVFFCVSPEVQAHEQINPATRELSLPAEFGGLNVPSLALDAELAHYASFEASVAILIIDYEYESLGPLYGIICH